MIQWEIEQTSTGYSVLKDDRYVDYDLEDLEDAKAVVRLSKGTEAILIHDDGFREKIKIKPRGRS